MAKCIRFKEFVKDIAFNYRDVAFPKRKIPIQPDTGNNGSLTTGEKARMLWSEEPTSQLSE